MSETQTHDDMLAEIRRAIIVSCRSATSARDIEAIASLAAAYTEAVESRPPPPDPIAPRSDVVDRLLSKLRTEIGSEHAQKRTTDYIDGLEQAFAWIRAETAVKSRPPPPDVTDRIGSTAHWSQETFVTISTALVKADLRDLARGTLELLESCDRAAACNGGTGVPALEARASAGAAVADRIRSLLRLPMRWGGPHPQEAAPDPRIREASREAR